MNIALRFEKFAKLLPHKKAIIYGGKNKEGKYDYPSLTFSELDTLSQTYATGLTNLGFREGMKTLLFVRPGLDFIALTLALFKMGVIPVLIDPGMGRKNLLRAIKKVRPSAMIAEPEVHIARVLFPSSFKTVKHFVSTGKFSFFGTKNLKWLKESAFGKPSFVTKEKAPEDMSAILFTSGGTGIPKGVEYTHLIFNTQTEILEKMFNLTPDDIDMPGFPLFSFFTMSMGMTSVLPDLDASKPATADPEALLKNIYDMSPTFVAGSPAIWQRLADYCHERAITLPSIRSLVMFGAPVTLKLHEKFAPILVGGTTYTPYGATESLPVANISGKEIIENHREKTLGGKGVCIGRPAPGIEIKIIKHCDTPIAFRNEMQECSVNETGEIIVKGNVVTRNYHLMEDETKLSKIYETDGTLWHRIGDLGHLDENGNLWFEGRKSHRVETKDGTLTTIPLELLYNQHQKVKRSALVGIGKRGEESPALVIETSDSLSVDELSEIKEKYPRSGLITKFYKLEKFPVDVRHNIKIDRTLLKKQAEEKKLTELH